MRRCTDEQIAFLNNRFNSFYVHPSNFFFRRSHPARQTSLKDLAGVHGFSRGSPAGISLVLMSGKKKRLSVLRFFLRFAVFIFAATHEEPPQVSIDRLAAIGFSLLGSFSPGAAAAERRSMVQIEDLMGLILASS